MKFPEETEATKVSLALARECVKGQVKQALNRRHRGLGIQLGYSELLIACLCQDSMLRPWLALFDAVLSELVKEGKVREMDGKVVEEFAGEEEFDTRRPRPIQMYQLTMAGLEDADGK